MTDTSWPLHAIGVLLLVANAAVCLEDGFTTPSSSVHIFALDNGARDYGIQLEHAAQANGLRVSILKVSPSESAASSHVKLREALSTIVSCTPTHFGIIVPTATSLVLQNSSSIINSFQKSAQHRAAHVVVNLGWSTKEFAAAGTVSDLYTFLLKLPVSTVTEAALPDDAVVDVQHQLFLSLDDPSVFSEIRLSPEHLLFVRTGSQPAIVFGSTDAGQMLLDRVANHFEAAYYTLNEPVTCVFVALHIPQWQGFRQYVFDGVLHQTFPKRQIVLWVGVQDSELPPELSPHNLTKQQELLGQYAEVRVALEVDELAARSDSMNEAVETNCSHYLWVQSAVLSLPTTLSRLVGAGKRVIGAGLASVALPRGGYLSNYWFSAADAKQRTALDQPVSSENANERIEEQRRGVWRVAVVSHVVLFHRELLARVDRTAKLRVLYEQLRTSGVQLWVDNTLDYGVLASADIVTNTMVWQRNATSLWHVDTAPTLWQREYLLRPLSEANATAHLLGCGGVVQTDVFKPALARDIAREWANVHGGSRLHNASLHALRSSLSATYLLPLIKTLLPQSNNTVFTDDVVMLHFVEHNGTETTVDLSAGGIRYHAVFLHGEQQGRIVLRLRDSDGEECKAEVYPSKGTVVLWARNSGTELGGLPEGFIVRPWVHRASEPPTAPITLAIHGPWSLRLLRKVDALLATTWTKGLISLSITCHVDALSGPASQYAGLQSWIATHPEVGRRVDIHLVVDDRSPLKGRRGYYASVGRNVAIEHTRTPAVVVLVGLAGVVPWGMEDRLIDGPVALALASPSPSPVVVGLPLLAVDGLDEASPATWGEAMASHSLMEGVMVRKITRSRQYRHPIVRWVELFGESTTNTSYWEDYGFHDRMAIGALLVIQPSGTSDKSQPIRFDTAFGGSADCAYHPDLGATATLYELYMRGIRVKVYHGANGTPFLWEGIDIDPSHPWWSRLLDDWEVLEIVENTELMRKKFGAMVTQHIAQTNESDCLVQLAEATALLRAELWHEAERLLSSAACRTDELRAVIDYGIGLSMEQQGAPIRQVMLRYNAASILAEANYRMALLHRGSGDYTHCFRAAKRGFENVGSHKYFVHSEGHDWGLQFLLCACGSNALMRSETEAQLALTACKDLMWEQTYPWWLEEELSQSYAKLTSVQ